MERRVAVRDLKTGDVFLVNDTRQTVSAVRYGENWTGSHGLKTARQMEITVEGGEVLTAHPGETVVVCNR